MTAIDSLAAAALLHLSRSDGSSTISDSNDFSRVLEPSHGYNIKAFVPETTKGSASRKRQLECAVGAASHMSTHGRPILGEPGGKRYAGLFNKAAATSIAALSRPLPAPASEGTKHNGLEKHWPAAVRAVAAPELQELPAGRNRSVNVIQGPLPVPGIQSNHPLRPQAAAATSRLSYARSYAKIMTSALPSAWLNPEQQHLCAVSDEHGHVQQQLQHHLDLRRVVMCQQLEPAMQNETTVQSFLLSHQQQHSHSATGPLFPQKAAKPGPIPSPRPVLSLSKAREPHQHSPQVAGSDFHIATSERAVGASGADPESKRRRHGTCLAPTDAAGCQAEWQVQAGWRPASDPSPAAWLLAAHPSADGVERLTVGTKAKRQADMAWDKEGHSREQAAPAKNKSGSSARGCGNSNGDGSGQEPQSGGGKGMCRQQSCLDMLDEWEGSPMGRSSNKPVVSPVYQRQLLMAEQAVKKGKMELQGTPTCAHIRAPATSFTRDGFALDERGLVPKLLRARGALCDVQMIQDDEKKRSDDEKKRSGQLGLRGREDMAARDRNETQKIFCSPPEFRHMTLEGKPHESYARGDEIDLRLSL